jgi:hypothetical protein
VRLGQVLRKVLAPGTVTDDFPGTRAPWEQTGETRQAWEERHRDPPVEGCRCLVCEGRRIARRQGQDPEPPVG